MPGFLVSGAAVYNVLDDRKEALLVFAMAAAADAAAMTTPQFLFLLVAILVSAKLMGELVAGVLLGSVLLIGGSLIVVAIVGK